MSQWFSAYFDTSPNTIRRLNPLVLDFSTDLELVDSPVDAAVSVVNQIVKTYPGPYTLLASGGIDSQAMIYAWHKSGVKFSVVHYNYGTNAADIESLSQFCFMNNIPFSMKFFDVVSFIESDEYKELAKRYDCTSPHILTYIKFVNQHPETCVMSGNFISLQGQAPFNWTILALQRFANLDKNNFIPFFFTFTPELAYSLLPYDVEIWKNQDTLFKSSYQVKAESYLAAGFNIIPQSDKFTGFEEIKSQYDSIRVPVRDKLKWANMPSKRPFDLLFRYALYDILPLGRYSEVVRLIHPNVINTTYPAPKDSINAIHR